ncbi:alpha,alpha-trehalase [Luteimonas cucumeris]|uniref:Putative periplasmic trehalase n=1 Tax=Luteimonas cucumeris TaxID=985012 RepID=A0A562LE45_9GAMM|nr:alpha,alpha-trehalase TreA [Luteimonas cucumeris]TWI05959.1 alpha,alpha-trehalase [Luteimonas cucumeris]
MQRDPRPLRFLLPLLLALLAGACTPQLQRAPAPEAPSSTRAVPPVPPDEAWPQLFAAVQEAQLFDDQKLFADAIPRAAPETIRSEYLAQHAQPDFDLRRFVDKHFALPQPAHTAQVTPQPNLRAHIDALWPLLTRSDDADAPHGSLLPLPHEYVVPGGRFREIYYWDSYFTMLGLVDSGRRDLARSMLDNFAWLIDTYGHIPNGNRSYYLSRSQPPFFSHMVELVADGDDDVLRRYLPQLKREHAFWMAGSETLAPGDATRRAVRLRDGSLLNCYWDDRDTPRPEAFLHDSATAAAAPQRSPHEVWRELRAGAESGWDYSSRWLDDGRRLETIRTTAIVPVDLNSLLHHLETTIARICALDAQPNCTREFSDRAARRKLAIETHLWHPRGYYTDHDWRRGQRRDALTAATLYPLFTGIASPERAASTAKAVRRELLRPGGLTTTTVETGQQWDAPNVWAPLQWIAVSGLRDYGHDALAQEIATNFLDNVQAVFAREHKLVEKYDADGPRGGGGGEYPLQDGFGWSNGVVRRMLVLYPRDVP